MLCTVYKEFKTSVELKKINQAGRKSAWKVQALEGGVGVNRREARVRGEKKHGYDKVPPPLQPPLHPHPFSPSNFCIKELASLCTHLVGRKPNRVLAIR